MRSEPPTERDFQSYVSLGIALVHSDVESRRYAEGISVYATLAQARRASLGMPRLGQLIAELVVPDDATATIQRTGRKPGHHTLWARPADVLQWIQSITKVEGADWRDRDAPG